MNANITQSWLIAQANCELNDILFEKHTLSPNLTLSSIRKSRIENHSHLFLTASRLPKEFYVY